MASVADRAAARLALPVAAAGVGSALAALAWFGLDPAGAERAAFVPLLRDEDARAVAGGELRGPLLRLMRDLVPITALALLFLAALGAWSGPRTDGVGGFVVLYLVWISALTMPHLVVVAWMDRGAPRR